ncbi:hypothetical protein Dform_02191 [Dehalogenimonas formicexedens]|uniref:Uncharacterized protein n=1 Tax=Dehalogenimonas formicexedens TaxID=1839801 RepID=A0A1P8FAL7_9CHLR|nr:hypothetical protein Dform_02191 [Dehalogenimonas formicexedens]
MKGILVGIAIILFGIALILASSGSGFGLAISLAGLLISIMSSTVRPNQGS